MSNRKEYMKKYQQENKDKIKNIQKRYYENNRVEIRRKINDKAIVNAINKIIYNINVGVISELERDDIVTILKRAKKIDNEGESTE